jgi:enoyl-CoA hydratase/carnithine racemase
VSDYEHIIYEQKDHVAALTFNFPEKLNAMDSVMTRELMEVLPDVQSDTSVRVLLLTGAGRGFRPDDHTERTAAKGDQHNSGSRCPRRLDERQLLARLLATCADPQRGAVVTAAHRRHRHGATPALHEQGPRRRGGVAHRPDHAAQRTGQADG